MLLRAVGMQHDAQTSADPISRPPAGDDAPASAPSDPSADPAAPPGDALAPAAGSGTEAALRRTFVALSMGCPAPALPRAAPDAPAWAMQMRWHVCIVHDAAVPSAAAQCAAIAGARPLLRSTAASRGFLFRLPHSLPATSLGG